MRPDACWITRELAQRLYGDTDPTGMTLNVESDNYTNGDNLLNTKYQINAGYPMPGIAFMAGLNLSF